MNEQDTAKPANSNEFINVNVTFGIRADDLIPDEMTKLLGIQPSHSFARGDEYVGHINLTEKGVRTREHGVWQVRSEEVVKSDDLQDHVDYLIDLLKGKQAEVKTLLADPDYYLDIRFWVEWPGYIHSFGIRSESISFLTSFCRDFNFSVIGAPDEDE
ncbi:DUF4279 domain-containing protein [Planctomycetota bacterium]|nr:DUF4279 domain-containing protein [Planctomycetota bacterium]